MRSMTGYGRADFVSDGLSLTVEIKTVNNRNFDFNSKMPRMFLSYEDLIRKIVASYVSRARIDLFITFSDKRQKSSQVSVNIEKAKSYYLASEMIAKELSIQNDYTVSSIMKAPEVIEDLSADDDGSIEECLADTVKKACEKLNEMRDVEGEKLVADMLCRLDVIEELRKKIAERAPLVAADYKKKLAERITEALGDVKYDEARLLNEVAFYTDKVNIDEELTRLGSHINQFLAIIKTPNCGKKLDFLMQEFNRETNTICSKSNDIEVTGFGLSLKNEIEKIREQVQNLE